MGLVLLLSLLLQDEDLVVTPSISPLAKCSLAPYQNVPLPPHKLHGELSLIPHLCRFVGVGRVSYTDRSRKEMQKGSSLQSSDHETFLFGRFHLIQAPCEVPQPLTLAFFSSRCCTSAWIISLLCLGSAFPHCWKLFFPSPCLPMHRFPMMSFNFSMLSACDTDVSTTHLHPDLVVMSASLTSSLLESLYIITALHFATLNSSTTDDRGSCPYQVPSRSILLVHGMEL